VSSHVSGLGRLLLPTAARILSISWRNSTIFRLPGPESHPIYISYQSSFCILQVAFLCSKSPLHSSLHTQHKLNIRQLFSTLTFPAELPYIHAIRRRNKHAIRNGSHSSHHAHSQAQREALVRNILASRSQRSHARGCQRPRQRFLFPSSL
jgi:hypothetical protein